MTPQERLRLCPRVLKPPVQLVSLYVVQQVLMLMLQLQQQPAVCLQQMQHPQQQAGQTLAV